MNWPPRCLRQSLVYCGVAIIALVTLALGATPAITADASAMTAPKCAVAGHGRPGDCIRHEMLDDAADGTIAGGHPFHVRLKADRSMRGKTLIVDVQYRSVGKSGARAWWTHRSILWNAQQTLRSVTHDFLVCPPISKGHYRMRTRLHLLSAGQTVIDSARNESSRSVRSPMARANSDRHATSAARTSSSSTTALSTLATSAPTSLTVTSSASACPNSPVDEEIIEYFNQIEFSDDIYLTITDVGTTISIGLSCPPSISPSIPPPVFLLSLFTSDNSQSISCNTGQITIATASVRQLSYCQPNGAVCSFVMFLSNSQTGAIFSETIVLLQLPLNGPNFSTYIPNLNPGTLPVCSNSFSPCSLSGTCQLSETKTTSLSS
jgi:hypothetical protein